MYREMPTSASSPNGMLSQNAQRQLTSVASQPPTSGPTAAMPPIVEPQIANAMPRSRPWNIALRVESVLGRTIAAPRPWTRREPMSIAGFTEAPANRLAAMNRTSPMANSRLRPYRSPNRPTVSMREAKTSE